MVPSMHKCILLTHPTSLSRCIPVGPSCSHSITHNHLAATYHHSTPFLKQPVQFLADIPKYWLEDDGTMCLDDSHRWKSNETIAWLRAQELHSVLNSIKAEIEDLVYNGSKKNLLDEMDFVPIKWTCTAFFWPRQLTDRAILAISHKRLLGTQIGGV